MSDFYHQHHTEPAVSLSRGEPASPRLHPREVAMVAITSAHLCFLPWSLGSMHRWSQLVSLAFALGGFILSLWPRPANEAATSPGLRLRRFPIFWAGLVSLLYIAVQGLNPAWVYTSNTDSWWLEPLAHLSWLPSGVEAPFARSNPWSALIIFASLWLLVCSVWIGLTRRRSYRLLFMVLIGNAFLLALLGILQQLTDAKQIFWLYLPKNGAFVSSFIYRNHAGPYLNLMVFLSLGFGYWHYKRSQKRQEQALTAALLAFAAVFIGIMVVFSYSRASIGILLAFLLFIIGFLAVRQFRGRAGSPRSRRNLLVLLIATCGFLGIVLVSFQAEKVWQRFVQIANDPLRSTGFRSIARQASADMLEDRWLFGWGAGCFRHGFPLYAQKYPNIYHAGAGNLRYWEHAHDDLLEFPIELGAVGMIPPLFALGFAGWQLIRRRFWRNGVSLALTLACGLVVVHAWVDFVFQNPAVLLTWGVLLIAAIRWLELDNPGAHPLAAGFARPDPEPATINNDTIRTFRNPAAFASFPRRNLQRQ